MHAKSRHVCVIRHVSFEAWKLLIYKAQFIYCFLWLLEFLVSYKNLSPKQRSERLTPMFSFKSSIVFVFAVRSLVNFEFWKSWFWQFIPALLLFLWRRGFWEIFLEIFIFGNHYFTFILKLFSFVLRHPSEIRPNGTFLSNIKWNL